MTGASEMFLSQPEHKARVDTIASCGTMLNLDNSAFDMEKEACKTDVMRTLAEIGHMIHDMSTQHKAHMERSLPTFLSALEQSIVDVAHNAAESLDAQNS